LILNAIGLSLGIVSVYLALGTGALFGGLIAAAIMGHFFSGDG